MAREFRGERGGINSSSSGGGGGGRHESSLREDSMREMNMSVKHDIIQSKRKKISFFHSKKIDNT